MKYELTNEKITHGGITLYRIRALIAFGDVPAGDFGGYIENKKNLEQHGDAWVYGDAWVFDNARVFGNAWVFDDAWVCGDAEVYARTHLLCVGPIGSRSGFTTFSRAKDNKICVSCGCFTGDIDKFEAAVKATHAGTKHEKTYMLAIELANAQIEMEE